MAAQNSSCVFKSARKKTPQPLRSLCLRIGLCVSCVCCVFFASPVCQLRQKIMQGFNCVACVALRGNWLLRCYATVRRCSAFHRRAADEHNTVRRRRLLLRLFGSAKANEYATSLLPQSIAQRALAVSQVAFTASQGTVCRCQPQMSASVS